MQKNRLTSFWSTCILIFTVAGIVLSISQLFLISPVVENTFLYSLMALFMSFVFIIYPATNKSNKENPPFYDVILFALTVGCATIFALNGFNILNDGWAFSSPLWASVLSVVFWIIALEAVRRAGGLILCLFTGLFSIYPIFSHVMPSILHSPNMEFMQVARFHIFGMESLNGIPMQVLGSTILGFIIFGSVLVAVGGGKFFLDFAASILGTQPGGPAKVSVLSSAIFGSLSGSVISNIVTTGSVTIPTMKKAGYPAHYAAAVEACASTGGMIMPPIMGATAFVMASMLNVPYVEVAIAAAFPAFLYFLAIYMQVHFFAERTNLQGMEKNNIPAFFPTLKKGLIYVIPVIVLVYFLYLRRESQAPFIASLALILFGLFTKETRINWSSLRQLIIDIGKTLSNLVALLAACGFIIGAFSLTGVGSSLSRELVQLAGGNVFLMLIFGAFGSFVLGMGMTVTACYIFLAIILAPALLASSSFDVMAVHMYILYFGIVSYITPPVALGSYTAAGVAGANPWKTGVQSVRLGIVSYIVPLFFVYSPSILLRGGNLYDIFFHCSTAILGVILLSAGIEGGFFRVRRLSLLERLFCIIIGLSLMVPNNIISLIAIGGMLIFLIILWLRKRFNIAGDAAVQ